MSRDLVNSYHIKSLNLANGHINTPYGYVESLGIFGTVNLQTYNMQAAAWSLDLTSSYGIGQIDGVFVHRNTVGGRVGDIPVLGLQERYAYTTTAPVYQDPLDTDAGWIMPATYEFEPRTGEAKYVNGAPVQLSDPFHIILRNSAAILKIIGLTDERVLVQCNFVSGGHNVTRIYTAPRSSSSSEAVLNRWQTAGMDTITPSLAANNNLYLIAPSTVNDSPNANCVGRDFTVRLLYTFDYSGAAWSTNNLTDTSLRNYDDTLPSSTGRTNIAVKATYSHHLKVFIAIYTDEVKIFSTELRPDTIAPPYAPITYYTPPDPGEWVYTGEHIYDSQKPSDWLNIVSISTTNPAVVTVAGSLSAWMTTHGIDDGDYVFFSGLVPFNGMKDRNDSTPSYCEFGFPRISFCNHRITVIDDTHFSVPVDGAACMDVNYLYGFDDYTGTGTVRDCLLYPYTRSSVQVGDQVIFGGFTPSDHPINGYITTVTYMDSGNNFHVDLPLGSWPATPSLYSEEYKIGWVKPYRSSGVYPVMPNNVSDSSIPPYISPSPCTVAFTNIDYTVDPPIFTVDREFWFDECSVEDVGETIKARAPGKDFSYALNGQRTLTKVTVNSFTTEAKEDFKYYVTFRSGGMPSTYHPTIRLWEKWVPVGAKIVLSQINGFPELEGVTTTVLSRDGQGYYVLDLDTTGLGPYDAGGSGFDLLGILQTTKRGGIHVGGPLDLDVAPPPDTSTPPTPVPLPFKAGVGFEVYTFVKGDRGEPAVGAIVTWSDVAGSIFDPPQSVCDENGKATTMCIVPRSWMGGLPTKNNTVTSATEW